MEISLPRRLNRETMYVVLQKAINKDRNPVSEEIVLDFSSLTSFIEPCGVTILSNLIQWLEKRNVTVHLLPGAVDKGECPNKFLDDSMFFEHHLGEKLSRFSQVRKTTIPLKKVDASSPIPWLITIFTPWLSRQLGVNPKQLVTIQVCIEEVLNNIRDHAEEKNGCIFAQYIPGNNEVVVSISDFGVGVPYKVQQIMPELTEADALLKAVQRGFSTQSTPQNRGFGLDNLIKNVVENGKGSVHIHSLNAMLTVKQKGSEISYKSKPSLGFYPGTLIDIVFKTDSTDIFDIPEEDFTWDEL